MQLGAPPESGAAGGAHTLAVKTDGGLWALESNNYGQLGICDYELHPTPVQIGTATAYRPTDSPINTAWAV